VALELHGLIPRVEMEEAECLMAVPEGEILAVEVEEAPEVGRGAMAAAAS
jgi:hypothetical protein